MAIFKGLWCCGRKRLRKLIANVVVFKHSIVKNNYRFFKADLALEQDGARSNCAGETH